MRSTIVTIGIPIYNAEPFLKNAIKSVLNQSFQNWELILTDDGSKDQSLKISKSFDDPRITILSDGKNRGISYRLNQQISLAKGKYFARMDADDIMFPDRLEKQVEFLENNSIIDVVGSYAVVIDDNQQVLGLRKSIIPKTLESCFRSVPFIHPTIMGKTDWFKKYMYINELKGVEDADLWVRSFLQSNFFVIEEPLMFYRDPLKIKFKTYKFRTLQSQRLCKTNMDLLKNSKINKLKLKLRGYSKLTIYWIFSILRMDKYLVSNRNCRIDRKSYNYYTSILDSIKI